MTAICEVCYHPFDPEDGGQVRDVPIEMGTVMTSTGRALRLYDVQKAYVCPSCARQQPERPEDAG
jgi:hypothetical protein